MRAEVLVGFVGVKDGEIYPRKWQPGDEIDGDLAKSAVQSGHAKMLPGAPENKMLDGARLGEFSGRTGEDKLSSSPRRARPKAERK